MSERNSTVTKSYPNCNYLGSDAAELSTFALTLRLVSMLKLDGHSDSCAKLMVYDNRACSCCKGTAP